MSNDINKYVSVMVLFNEWNTDPRKHLYKELFSKSNNYTDYLVIQHPIGLLIHSLISFRNKTWKFIKGKFKPYVLMKNVLLITPVIFTHFVLMLKGSFIFKVDRILFSHQVNKILKSKYDAKKIILWINNPLLYFLIEKVKYNFVIYDYQDNFGLNYEGKKCEPGYSLNYKVIQKSDLVVCTSNSMYEKAKNLNNNSILVNNGNDYETLAKNDLLNIQNELSNINKPIIGYLGGIRNWIDFDLLEYLINEIKEAHFVFISLVYRNAKPNFIKLLSHKNVTWIKYKQQNELPSYLRKFNVGLIPFKINKFMDGVFPNKFFEYMACEVPIVTTALPELEKYSQIIGFSQTRQDFLKNCKMAINGNFDEKVKFYSELAKINSWSNKAEYINTHIKNILNI